jgi:hypothetical protein
MDMFSAKYSTAVTYLRSDTLSVVNMSVLVFYIVTQCGLVG